MTMLQRFTLALLFSIAASFALSACDDEETNNEPTDTAGDTTGDATSDTRDTTGDTSGADPCQGKTLCATEGARRCETAPERIVECREDADGCLVEQATTQCGAGESCEGNNGSPICVNPCADLAPEDVCDAINTKQCNGDTLEACESNADNCLVWNTQADCTAETGSNSCGEVNSVAACVFDICRDEATCTPGVTCDGDTLTTCRTDPSGCLEEVTFDCTTTTGSTCDAANSVCTTTGDPCDGVDPSALCDTAGAMCNPDNPDELWTCAPNAFGCLVAQATDCAALPGLPTGSTGYCDGTDANAAACAIDPGDRCAGETLCAETDPMGATCNTEATQLVTCAYNAIGCYVQTTETCAETDPTFVCVEAADADDLCTTPPPACTDDCALTDTSCDAGFIMVCAADGDADPCLEFVQGTDCIAANQACDASSGTALCVTANETCTSALLIAPPFTVAGSTTGVTDDLAGTTDCAAFTGTDLVFSLSVSTGDFIHVREVGDQGAFGQDSFVQVQSTCGDSACEAIIGRPDDERGILYAVTADGTLFPSVEFDTAATDYDVRINAVTFTDIGTFAAADPIPDQVSTTPLTDGDSAFYTITFSEDVLLSGTATSTGGDIDLFIYSLAGDFITSYAVGGDEDFTDLSLSAGTYIIWAYAYYASGDIDAHTLTFTARTTVCGDNIIEGTEVCDDGNNIDGDGCSADCSAVDAGDTCADPIMIASTGTVSGNTDPYSPDYDGLCSQTQAGNDAIYAIDVPDGNRLDVGLTASFDAVLNLSTDCADLVTSCQDSSDNGFGIEAASYTNFSGSTQQVFIVVDGFNDFDAGTFDLTTALLGVTPEVCDDTVDNDGDTLVDCFDTLDCATAPNCSGVCLVAGTRTGDLGSATGNSVATGTASGLSQYSGSCGGGSGPDAAYDWTAPSDGCFRLDTLGSSYDTVLHVKGCDDGNQVGCNDDGAGAGTRSVLDITVTAGEALVIVVDSFGAAGGDYVLSINACP